MTDPRTTAYARDQGECAHCGLPCGVIDEALKVALLVLTDWHGWKKAVKMANQMAVEWWGGKPGTHGKPPQSLWEADHIVQQAHGGSDDASNLQTLCVPCHARNTALQAGEAAKEVRAQHSIPGYDKAYKATRAQRSRPNKRMPGVNAPVHNGPR